MNNDVNKKGADFTVAPPGPHNDLTATEALQYELSQSALSRHSPEGFDEVLKASSEDVVPDVDDSSYEAEQKAGARKAAKLLESWASGETLEFSSMATNWSWQTYISSASPNVTSTGVRWRIKLIPRKVYVAFHESGSVADVRAMPPALDVPGRSSSDYIEFEEKLG